MRVVNVLQGSEAWEKLRCGIPTTSSFDRIITPVKGDLSDAWRGYAVELLGEELGVIVPAPPTYWQQHGMDTEPYAVAAYEKIKGVQTQVVGFVWPDDHARYGSSPDRLVGDDGLLEVKCPQPEKVIEYHAYGVLPKAYKPQVQGQLLVTGRKWCDFVAYHPDLAPLIIRVERDEPYIEKMSEALDEFCEKLDELREKLQGIDRVVDVQLNDDYQPITYVSDGGPL